MRFLKLLIVLGLFGCATTTRFPDPEKPTDKAKVAIQIISIETYQYSFIIGMRISEWTDFPGVIQEIILDDGQTLVEYFDLPNGTHPTSNYDQQSMSGINKHVRKMRLYPARVKDLDAYTSGFGQLIQNKDGSVVTKINTYFNTDYQWKKGPNGESADPKYGVNHKTTGVVVEDDRANSIYWSIEFDKGIVRAILPDNTVVEIGSTHTGA